MVFVGIVITLMLSALFSGMEIAYLSANKLVIELKKKHQSSRGAIIEGFYNDPARFLSTMLVGNNIALVIFTILMTTLIDTYIAQYIPSEFILAITSTLIITLVVLLFGEFIPKIFFRLFADSILFAFAYPVKLLYWILAIPTWFMNTTSKMILKVIFNMKDEETEEVFTRLDLENYIKSSSIGSESEEEVDTELFEKALYLSDVRVRDVMVPRTEIEFIDASENNSQLIALFRTTQLSRIIVVEEDLDNTLGYVHHQQLLLNPQTPIKKIVMELTFIPEVMRVRDAINLFLKNKLNVACVVDEYGGTAGLITMEDLLEEIFGEIEDEHDSEEYTDEQITETEFLFSGRLEVDALAQKYVNFQVPEGDYTTLSGYLVMTIGAIPSKGEEIVLEGVRYIFEEVSDTKIELVRVLLPQTETSSAEAE